MEQGRIRWSHLDEATFNELVETLLVREFSTDGQIAMAVDGRGGDEGIDIDVRAKRSDQLIRIFQLKYFPEGFSGGFVNRRTQIKRSLQEALKHNPPAWTLVVPRNVTVKERQAVRAMRKGHDVRVSFMTPTEMNALLAKHRDIEERFTVDRAVELLKAVNREEAAMIRPGDLRSEIDRISNRVEGRSEYWGTAFAVEPDGSYQETYFPKRPDAFEREPLGATFTLSFSEEDGPLKTQWESAMKFGTIERLVLPTHTVQSFEKTGPAWFSEVLEHVELEFGPVGDAHQPISVRIDARDDAGRVKATLRGKTTSFAHGFGGYTFDAALEGGVNQRWTMPSDSGEAGKVVFGAEFEGASAREIRRVLRFNAAMTESSVLGVYLNDSGPTLLTVAGDEWGSPDPQFVAFIEDVCALEAHFDLDLLLPHHIDSSDLIWARILRLLIEGKATAHPHNGTFGGTLDGENDPTLDVLLTEGNAICVDRSGFEIGFFGERLVLDHVRYYAHHAMVDDAAAVRRAIDAGAAAGTQIAIRPVDDIPWIIYSPEHATNAGRAEVVPQPWGIDGVREHPGFGRLPRLEK
ncbi:hypothetical protein ACFVWL_11355 [Microbacterium sp. NPDC058269]|uniref:hypothetical protein n=1 Tax=Microbacterium sp. NPDC058269 TaxID=3346414 RepID=UPI0036D8231E